jgi:hypothetical protein
MSTPHTISHHVSLQRLTQKLSSPNQLETLKNNNDSKKNMPKDSFSSYKPVSLISYSLLALSWYKLEHHIIIKDIETFEL